MKVFRQLVIKEKGACSSEKLHYSEPNENSYLLIVLTTETYASV